MTARPADRPPRPPRLPDELAPVDAAAGDELAWDAALVTGDRTGHQGDALDVDGCRLLGLRLAGAGVERARVTNAVFERCDLSGAVLGSAALHRVEMVECRLSGLVLAGGRMDDVRFRECKLDGANLRMATGQHVSFEGCSLVDADLGGATLARARFFDCDLTGVELSHARLAGARLHGSTVDRARGAAALAGAVIDSGQLLPVGLLVLGALGIRVDDDRGPGSSAT